jgi:hypothetical protein
MPDSGSRRRRVVVSVIAVISLLTSMLVVTVAVHLTKAALGELLEQIILLIVAVAAMACVIGSLLIHGRRIVFWLFFGGFLLSPFAQAQDDSVLTAVGIAFFVGPLAWNYFILRRLIDEEYAVSGTHETPKI